MNFVSPAPVSPLIPPAPAKVGLLDQLQSALRAQGFVGEIERDAALRLAMSTDNSVYQLIPDLIVAPKDTADLHRLVKVMAQAPFAHLPITARGGGTGTNGQSLNKGVIVDLKRHMHRLIAVNVAEGWADVEPGMVLDDLNEQLRPKGLFFAPETSTSTRCTIGGMVGTDASGKGSRIYGKTSDNIIGLDLVRPEGILSSLEASPAWAEPLLSKAEAAARAGRDAFIAATPQLNRRFTGYDLERAAAPGQPFEWWRLFLGAEGTLGLLSRIRVQLRPIEPEKRLLVVGFDSFRAALRAATPLLEANPTAIEVMDELVQRMAHQAGILSRLPAALQVQDGESIAYVFVEFNGSDPANLDRDLAACHLILQGLDGVGAVHIAADREEIKALWAIRSAGVGLLGKVDGPSRPVAFVEDCVVPPENLPEFLDGFQNVLKAEGLGFGIYGHVDVGCLHVRPALNLDHQPDRDKLLKVSDAVYGLTKKYGGIFWGEHGKGVRGAYLREWIGEEAYGALRNVKAAFDPQGRYNAGKLVTLTDEIYGISTTPFRAFNAPDGDALTRAFRCNGNAQCLSYQRAVPMCPSYKASLDLRLSPKGRADGLREWHRLRGTAEVEELEAGLVKTLDACLGCKACASSCPVQVDIPSMRSAFYADYYARNARPLGDTLLLLAERFSPALVKMAPLLRPFWPLLAKLGGAIGGMVDMPNHLARPTKAQIAGPSARRVILVQDWFSAAFDGQAQEDIVQGLRALGYTPVFMAMRPGGKAAQTLGDTAGFKRQATALAAALHQSAESGAPLVGIDPAFVMQLRQDYPKAGIELPKVLLLQEFLAAELKEGVVFPTAKAPQALSATVFGHCTEVTALPHSAALWGEIYKAVGIAVDQPASGCCGMAGTFGHQKRHYDMSQKLFEMSWAPQIKGQEQVYATGFSCRCQVERMSEAKARHPMRLIADALAS